MTMGVTDRANIRRCKLYYNSDILLNSKVSDELDDDINETNEIMED